MGYEEAEAFLLGIPRFAKKNTPKDTKAFLRRLGDPGRDRIIVHVAGTNGKGSVCAYLSSVLQQGGYRVGLFTSPHLVTMRERFRVDGELIGEDDFISTLSYVNSRLDDFKKENSAYHPSFFEMLFFMAMLYFEKKEVQVILLETGLGGRLDATNSVSRKDLCVITRIGMDHMEYLGDTLSLIAGEKAGILQHGIPLVYGDYGPQAGSVIEKRARELACPVFYVSKQDIRNLDFHKNFIDFSMETRYYGYIRCTIHACAPYQTENAALALRALDALAGRLPVCETALLQGMASTRWEGRMEEIGKGVYLDGAHNVDGIRALLEAVLRDGCRGRRFLLFSAVKDKQYEEIIAILCDCGLFSIIYVTELKNTRGIPLGTLEAAFHAAGAETVYGIADAGSAYRQVLAQKHPEDMVYIAGSLYLAGEIKSQ